MTTRTRILIATFAAFLPFVLQAQGIPQEIEEVIVTAMKRAESIQDVPVSITALSSSELEGLKLRDTGEIAQQVPNLQTSEISGNGIPIFSLRGVSMNDFSFNQHSPVAIYVDEVYKGNPSLKGVQLYDLERVEVLRGPQGTLYGKNSTGGAINFITQQPVMENEGYFRAGMGNYGLKEARGAANFVIGESLAVRLAGTWTEADGWLENKNPGVDDGDALDEYGVRLSVLWEANDSLNVLFRAAKGKSEGVNYGIVADEVGPSGIGAGVYGLYNALGATSRVDGTREGLGFWEFESEQDLERLVESDSLSLTINWDFGNDLTLTSISSYDDGEVFVPEDVDGTFNTLLNGYYAAEAEQFTQEVRITSDYEGPFNFIAGLYYANEDIKDQTTIMYAQDLDLNLDGNLNYADCSDPLFMAFGFNELVTEAGLATDALFGEFGFSLADFAIYGCQTQNDFDQELTSKAAFFDGSYDLNDNWTLRLGLRYTEDETELSNFSARVLGNDGIPIFATIPFDDANPYATLPKRDFTDDEITGKLGIDYTTENENLFYASYSRGYRSGAYNAQAFLDVAEVTQVEPETLDAFEAGFKMSLLDGSVQLNGAAFYYTYKNQQFLNIDEQLVQTLINISESEITGLELEMVARPVQSLLIRAGLGLIDTEVKKGILNGQDLAGNQLPQAPEVNFNLAADWNLFNSKAGSLVLHMDGTYTDKQYFEVANVSHTQADSYFVANGMLTFQSANANWAVSVWGKNLFEEKYHTSILDLQGFFGYNYTHVGAPRTYGVEVTYRY